MSNTKKNLKEGCFYLTHDGSKSGHPGMIYWKNDEKNLYLAFKTDTSSGPHRIEISKTENKVKKSFVSTRPFLGKRKDFGSKILDKMSFSVEDYDILITISKREPNYSKSINRKDKRNLPRDTTFKPKQ